MPAGLLTSREAQVRGGAIFATNCALCHGVKGDGHGLRQEGMNPPPANLALIAWSESARANRVFQVVRNGIQGTAMPSWPMLSDQQVWDLVAYVYSLRSL
jgi:high-affinity iron transporter